jgi:ribosomal protein L31
MKANIHPQYHTAARVTCVCGNTFNRLNRAVLHINCTVNVIHFIPVNNASWIPAQS